MLYVTLASERFEVTGQERREVIGSQRLDLVSHRFVVVDHEFKTLDEGFFLTAMKCFFRDLLSLNRKNRV